MLEIKPIIHSLVRSKAGAVLLILQIAITLAIVSNSLSIIKDRLEYLNKDTGYPEKDVFYITTNVFAVDTELLYLIEETEKTLRGMDGVVNASYMSDVPLSGSGSASSFGNKPMDQDEEKGYLSARTGQSNAGSQVFDTLGLVLKEGRLFNETEVLKIDGARELPQKVVVTQDYINEVYPEGNGVGQFIYIGNTPVEIIGVVERAMGAWPSDEAALNYSIFPYVGASTSQKFVVRAASGMRETVMKEVEDILLAQFNERVIMNVQGFDDAKKEYQASDILMLRMLVILIALLVSITALGIFGMTVFNINKRTKQIGTRRALGARKADIVRYFLVENSILCIAGMTLGAIGAIYLGQILFEHYSVPAFSKAYIVYTAVFILSVSILSVLFPANKAANISPSIATRSV
ncbi:MAG: FtsX-like permease family protein [Pseudomonadota bacterium]